ncbi:MAG: hypothetical protein ACFB14_01985 [Leptolyngbyaceae cyanobacterium]
MSTPKIFVGKPVEDSPIDTLDSLHHKLLQALKGSDATRPETIEQIRDTIRSMLPKVDTCGSLPQKKTPGGRTNVLHINYVQTPQSGETGLGYLRFFASIATALGLRLEILTDPSCRDGVEQELTSEAYKALRYAIAESQKPVSKWAEDSVEYLENGNVAVLRHLDDSLLEWAMIKGRRHRWQGKIDPENFDEALREDRLWILLGVRVNALEMGSEREYAEQTKKRRVSHIRTYIEGGNMIAGEDASGRSIVLVGRDAIATTAHIYQLSEKAVRRLICEDFGLDTIEQVVCVEQPGQFHLDMGMLFLGNGIVVVNDSREALKDAVEMAQLAPCLTTEKMAAKLQLQCSLEQDAVNDLDSAGLSVKRKKLESDVLYNFFNGEFVEGSDGGSYYITNGGPKDHEETFATLMTTEWQVVKKVFFSPQPIAQKSLQDRGGVGCRIKGERVSL